MAKYNKKQTILQKNYKKIKNKLQRVKFIVFTHELLYNKISRIFCKS